MMIQDLLSGGGWSDICWRGEGRRRYKKKEAMIVDKVVGILLTCRDRESVYLCTSTKFQGPSNLHFAS